MMGNSGLELLCFQERFSGCVDIHSCGAKASDCKLAPRQIYQAIPVIFAKHATFFRLLTAVAVSTQNQWQTGLAAAPSCSRFAATYGLHVLQPP